jgi:tetratricopeptide (TPR) repeat protein
MIEQAQLLRQVRLALQNGDYPLAIQGLEQAVLLAQQADDHALEGRHLGNLALIYYRLGHAEQALDYFDRALASARADDDRTTENGLLGNIGNILRELGRYEEAIDYLNQALLIAQEIGDDRGRGIWLGNLGLVYDDLGRQQDAIPLHEQSIVIARQLHDLRGLVARLGNVGNSYVSRGEHEKALVYFKEATLIYRDLGDKSALAQRLGIVGNLYATLARQKVEASGGRLVEEALRNYTMALDYYRQTLIIAQELGDQSSIVELIKAMGGISAEIGDQEGAVVYFQIARQQYDALNLPEQVSELDEIIKLLQDA